MSAFSSAYFGKKYIYTYLFTDAPSVFFETSQGDLCSHCLWNLRFVVPLVGNRKATSGSHGSSSNLCQGLCFHRVFYNIFLNPRVTCTVTNFNKPSLKMTLPSFRVSVYRAHNKNCSVPLIFVVLSASTLKLSEALVSFKSLFKWNEQKYLWFHFAFGGLDK